MFQLPDLGAATPWSGLDKAPDRDGEFSFVLLSDRTGMAQPGVFERGVAVTNLLRPDFAIQIGDTIEGYTRDADDLAAMWKEYDGITGELQVPLFAVPGNHDLGNDLMRDTWLARHGALDYHFRYRDVLFLVLDTQDPPQTITDLLRPVDEDAAAALPASLRALVADDRERTEQDVLADLQRIGAEDPGAVQLLLKAIKDGTQPGRIGDDQVDQLVAAVAEHADVRWTVVLMHMPMWQGAGHPALDRLREALGDRPYTAFAGHAHNYKHSRIDGRDHVRLGSTGGIRSGDGEGSFDHVAWVTMTPSGPLVANLLLDGVLDVTGAAPTDGIA